MKGTVSAPPSKSELHRLLICAALSDRETKIESFSPSGDITATLRCLRALGAEFENDIVTPIRKVPDRALLDCGDSGSTLRFLAPLASALGVEAELRMGEGLKKRPVGFSLPLTLTGHDFTVDGSLSSQIVSGYLFALTRLGGALTVTGKEVSGPYIDMTVNTLAEFGASIRREGNRYFMEKTCPLRSPGTVRAGGDWSGGAFLLLAGLIGKTPVTVTGLREDSTQGDREIVSILRRMGGDLRWEGDGLTAYPSSLRGIAVSVENIPDLAPVIAVAGAFAEGKTVISGASRLRYKESDRLESVCGLIRDLGGKAEADPDGMTIFGGGLRGGIADSRGDHRIAMAAGIAAVGCREPVTVLGAEAVEKSFPGFWELLEDRT